MMREFEIERQFNIKIEHIKPNKGVYFVKTNQGNKCLKKIENSFTDDVDIVFGNVLIFSEKTKKI